ncbi:hypothetical protein BASA81_000317 [Batrachochytrium salamandrivorans]|nr:hypothetical protein BASA81_000317 [Batrachochytrium salamandrivorans]
MSLLGQSVLYVPAAASLGAASESLGAASDLVLNKIPSASSELEHAYAIDGESAMFVVTASGVTGNIPTQDGFLHLSPCLLEQSIPNCHVLTTVTRAGSDAPGTDAVTMPPEHALTSAADVINGGDQMCAKGKLSDDGLYCCKTLPCTGDGQSFTNSCGSSQPPCFMLVVQTVYVAYTPQALVSTRDMDGVIKLAIAETNQGYVNSKIPIRLELKGSSMRTDVLETGNSLDMLSSFRGANNMGADMAVLLSDSIESCGRAYLDCAPYAANSCAYAVVKMSCATGYYSFGHELGHLQGADHNVASGSGPTRFTDNFGLVITPGYGTDAIRTVMAYAIYNERRILYFSNPLVKVEGDKPTGVLGSTNNARVLAFTRYAIASLGTEGGAVFGTAEPTSKSTAGPTARPTIRPTVKPTTRPTTRPTIKPTKLPTTSKPTARPTTRPTLRPTKQPTTIKPTAAPTTKPTLRPTSRPTTQPTTRPTLEPTLLPATPITTHFPTLKPTKIATTAPVTTPTPVFEATLGPTQFPTFRPTRQMTDSPTSTPLEEEEATSSPTSRIITRFPTPSLDIFAQTRIKSPRPAPAATFTRYPTSIQAQFLREGEDKTVESASTSSTIAVAVAVPVGLLILVLLVIVKRRRQTSNAPSSSSPNAMGGQAR